jgi:TolA-binding protein
MKTAPADSLPILQAEYQRLLDEANGEDRIQTGMHADESEPKSVTSTPRRPTTDQMHGFRESELKGSGRSIAGAAPPATPEERPSYVRRGAAGAAPVSHTSTVRRSTPAEPLSHASTVRRSASASEPAAATPETPAEVTSNDRDRKFINGIAASRAGHYAEAASELPEVVASPPAGKKVLSQYSYAQSLEKTGNLTKAADQYLKASKGSEDLSDKSYLSYCRVLARSGERDRARKLLAQFIAEHPKSSEVVTARRLLQTL